MAASENGPEKNENLDTELDLEDSSPNTVRLPPQRQNPLQASEDFYLRQATKEFANDLDKLRSASDFNPERSVPMLIRALKSGSVTFSEDERRRIGEAVAAADPDQDMGLAGEH